MIRSPSSRRLSVCSTRTETLLMETKKKSREAHGYAARDSSGFLSPFSFTRRLNEDDDVTIKILYCGICHSDLHLARNELGFSVYPLVPGHEIVGEVIEIGANVQTFKVGDKAGVGCIVGSCGSCDSCLQNLECYCKKSILTYSSTDRDGSITYGGYSDIIVVHQRFVFNIPHSLPLHSAAPLLCAGISVYSPMRFFGLDRPGLHLGVVGLGGLGHLAVKFAKAMEMRVTVISTSPHKQKEAIERFGADKFVISTNDEQMKEVMGSMDGIIDTVSAAHPMEPLMDLLKVQGKLVVVGGSPEPLLVPSIPLLMGRKIVAGSICGGTKETQEMLNFAAENKIEADVEIIPMSYVNTAMERLFKGDIKYRFVIDPISV
ncbi:probable mannitol dehydrogenase isoform X2 [Dendrobium catenatum]|uniref:probable mannitol dehydrogenase isoform X2 n=1 Tax=Dendrobium catenatum TaxID=906689 RepID=UPI0010A0397F|nr:probable mannitol dehydrogenase isoform X2 [Dendrobium catenatum]